MRRLAIVLPPDLIHDLRVLAAERDTTMTNIIADLIRQAVAAAKKGGERKKD